MSTEEKSSVDIFELIMAVVLGLAAIGGGLAGYQGGLWAGNQATSFGQASNTMTEAAAVTTEAGAIYNAAVQTASRDADIDLQVKRLLIDNLINQDTSPQGEAHKLKNLLLARYMLTTQLSEEAYEYLELPKEMYKSENWDKLPEKAMEKSADLSLDDEYFNKMVQPAAVELQKAAELQEKAQKQFQQGRKENYTGDQFSFTGVLFTVCLFLAGIGLVFKSNIKWVFGGLGTVALLIAMVDLFGNPWTESMPVPDEPEAAASAAPAGSAAAAGSAAPADDEAAEEKEEE